MDRLDLRQLEYFLAVAEELHFGRAAERLHIAQPSLSQQIRRLEAQVGAPLLHRTSRRVELTEAGAALLREGRRTLRQAERTLAAARAEDRLLVGFTGTAGAGLLTPVLSAYAEDRPEVKVIVRELELGDVPQLITGGVDVAFTRLRPGEADLEIEILAHEQRLVALSSRHRLARRATIALADLAPDPFITVPHSHNPRWRSEWLEEQSRHGLPGTIAAEVTSLEQLVTLVAAGRGVCVVPASNAQLYPREGVVYIPLTDAEPAVVGLAWPTGASRQTVRDFLDTARRIARRAAPPNSPAQRTPV
jgi:DNA-binding transcriptional LysR family regulator